MPLTPKDETPGSSDTVVPTASWGELFAPARRMIATTLAAGVVLHAVNVYLATTILPSVTADIGGLSLYAWTTTIFVFASVLGSTSAAALLSRAGARWAYRLAALVLGLGTVLCAVAPSMPVLLAGRLVQGIGGGLLFALSYAMVRLVFDPPLWPRAMALVSAMWGVATLVGPALGGVFAQADAWRLSFWVLVPAIAVFATSGAGCLPVRGDRGGSVHVPLASVAVLAIGVLVISAASTSESVTFNAVGIAVAVLSLVGWLWRERSSGARLLPADTYAAGSRLPWLYLTMALLVIATTVEVFVPYFGQVLQGLSPLWAGYLGAAMAAGWTIASIAFSGVQGPRRAAVLTTAPLISSAGLVVLALTGPLARGSAPVLAGVAAGLVLLGWGVGMTWPHLLSDVLASASDADRELAGSSVTTLQMVATAFGSAIAGLTVNLAGFTDPGGVPGTSNAARWLFAAFLVTPLLAVLTTQAGRRRNADVHPGQERSSA